jgi:1-acyl-sn-glycerol-3-phosphate acyltransferase
MRSKVYSVFTILGFGILYCFTAITVIIVLVLALFRLKVVIRYVSQLWANGVFLLIGKKIYVRGNENINKENRYILVANHASLFDIMAIMSFYPGVSWFGHERLLKVPVFGFILKLLNYVPFKTPTVKNTKEMLEQLASKSKNQTVAIFPEGTRTIDGKINHFHKGFIYLFRASDVGILPVTLNGFFELKPKNRLMIDFDSKLEVVIHKPIKRDDLIDKSDAEIIETVKAVVESTYNK